MRHKFVVLAVLGLLLVPITAVAQQTGAIAGKVTGSDGLALPGVTVEAAGDVVSGGRLAVTGSNGEYRLAALPPGNYKVTFTLSGMQTVTRAAQVQLSQDTFVNATLSVQGVTETVTVTATTTLVDPGAATIKSGVSAAQIASLPVGQEYRDLLKLIPGVMYSQDETRGPSNGGSGQDNVYQFDGVNVTLPLFGTLSAEPASHDIAQITTIKGGARAVDFDRSGGFSIDSLSKSGGSRFSGLLNYQIQRDGMAAALKSGSLSRYDQDRTWITGNVGGPVLPGKVFFYGSYYRPEISRANRANLYGDLPDYESIRNEGFGKITLTPTSSILLNVSYRDSHRLDKSSLFGSSSANTTGTGNEAWQKIGTAEGSWLIGSQSVLNFKYTHFVIETQGRPDNVSAAEISTAIGTRLDTANLDKLGLLSVPTLISGQTAYNAFVQPLIDRYGYLTNGVRTGGGLVGFGTTFDEDNFFRDSVQFGYDLTLGSHSLHVGYQRYTDSEDLVRSSNGWGGITVPGGRISFNGTPIYYTAAFQQQGIGAVPVIHSEYQSQNIEFNDSIRLNNWTINVGVVASNDTLYGQGLRDAPGTLSGYSLAVGNKYKMYEVPFKKMLQPRVSVVRATEGGNTVFASLARYNPAASSLPRAASWDRNLATTINAHFDATGALFGTTAVASSSGKLFVPDMDPRRVDEYMIGTSMQMSDRWSARAYARYRKGSHFWEDTNNTARTAFNPPAGIPRTLYIADLTARIAQIGSGSTYVIAELDGAFTKYYETTVESEFRSSKVFVRGSYTWSHYYGNFDQDSTTTANDANVFIGSSFVADGAGRQLWNNREGDLRGDRRHMFKVYGTYELDWNASAGAYFVAQSGQPWEAWSYEPYIALTTNTSDTSRFLEPAGSRLTPAHWQLDLKYTQRFRMKGRMSVDVVGDLFNVMNKQTGYNYQPAVHAATFGVPRSYYTPRRFQLAVQVGF